MNGFTRFAALALCALAPVAAAPALAAEESVWAALQRGGHVVLIRHAETTPGVGDPPGFKIDDCSTQRNLSDAGRAQARRLGDAFRARGVAVERLLSSPWCRCLETAELAFRRTPQVAQALANFFGAPEQRDALVAGLRRIVADHRGRGNLVLVTHGVSIGALTGVGAGMGTIVVAKPEGDGRFTVVGSAAVP
jgi:broad specificity phosphatase PhoE